MMKLDMIMSTDLKTVAPTDSLAAVRAIMHDNRIHHVPVVDEDDDLVGLVTLTDVLAATRSSFLAMSAGVRSWRWTILMTAPNG